ncbi:MAG: dUTP diphosphatase [Candidatus Cloacimonetes bacterium]|nr:dUTP diphosphatase [Candidatus Cloacimonadota bacterium]
MLEIKFKKLNDNAQKPARMTSHAAGYDLYSANENPIILKPNRVTLVPTGIAISLPVSYEAQIRPRSGLALKNQIGILNSPGTIDADYRGEIQIIAFNFGTEEFVIKPHTRIAQMIISKHEIAEFVLSETLDATDRGKGGFGHTKH